jgi:AcrR family transcriptional regulator
MSRRRFENLEPGRQRRLFDSAVREFALHGYEGASLNRILEQSGMGKSSFYYYFDDKADLFTTLVERMLAVLFSEIGGLDPDALTAENYWSTFEAVYGRAMAVIEKNTALVRFGGMFYRLRATPEKESSTGRLFQEARDWVEDIVRRGQALGVVRTDLPQSLLIDTVMAVLESLDRWFVTHWEELSEPEKSRMPHDHVGLFRRLLSNG